MNVYGILQAAGLFKGQGVKMRQEKDSMGVFQLPDDVYYGVQTARAIENFPISGIKADLDFIKASIYVKKAAAKINAELGQLDKRVSEAIIKESDEVLDGKLIK